MPRNTRSVSRLGLLLLALLSACPSDKDAGSTGDSETCGDGESVTADTAACAGDSSEYDGCNWCLREVSACARELARLSSLEGWDGEALGLSVLRSEEDLADWWGHIGTTASVDVDFSKEIAVGYVAEYTYGCDEEAPVGLAEGDAAGTWILGVHERSWCDSACDLYRQTATLYAVPTGEVSTCTYGAFCDG